MDDADKAKIGADLSDQCAGLFLGFIIIMIICVPAWIICGV